jgi:hypothetical protein
MSFDEFPWVPLKFFLAASGAEVDGLSFKIYLEFCCFFVKHGAAHRVSQLMTSMFLLKVQFHI